MQTVEPTGEIHESADVFPMLPEDELQELAVDIKTNGLIHPIVLDDAGTLIDGGNRLAACRIAGVEPTYASLNGSDPVAYILSANIARRNLTKGQRAMAVAKLLLSSNGSQAEGAQSSGVSQQRVSQANTVIRNAPELADAVMAGTMPLNDAYAQARQRKDEKETRQEQAMRTERDLAALRIHAPDLADLVAEERIPLRDAVAAKRQRDEEERREREDVTQTTARAVVNLWAILVQGPDRIADRWVDGINRQKDYGEMTEHLWTGDGLRTLADQIVQFAAAADRRGGLH